MKIDVGVWERHFMSVSVTWPVAGTRSQFRTDDAGNSTAQRGMNMVWAVSFRGKDFNLDDNFDPVFEFAIREELFDVVDVPGSIAVVFYGDDIVTNITFDESSDSDELPLTGIHARHPRLGDVYIFYGAPEEEEPRLIFLYEVDDSCPPLNEKRFPLLNPRKSR